MLGVVQTQSKKTWAFSSDTSCLAEDFVPSSSRSHHHRSCSHSNSCFPFIFASSTLEISKQWTSGPDHLVVPKARSQQSVADPETARSLMFNRNPTSPATAPEPLFYSINQCVRYFRDGNKTCTITSFFLKGQSYCTLVVPRWTSYYKNDSQLLDSKDSTKNLGFTSPEHWEVPSSAGIRMSKLEREQFSPWDMSEDKSLDPS